MTKDEIRTWLRGFCADENRGVTIEAWASYFMVGYYQLKRIREGGEITAGQKIRLERAIDRWQSGAVEPKEIMLPKGKTGVILIETTDPPKLERPMMKVTMGTGGPRLQIGMHNPRDYRRK
jgi:hypothetical protein